MSTVSDNHPFMKHWRDLAHEIQRPDFELDVEAFAELLRAYHNLCSVGYEPDVMLTALMKQLVSQCKDTHEALDEGDDDLHSDNNILPARFVRCSAGSVNR